MCTIRWDTERTQVETPAFLLTIQTGMSIGLSNRLTTLRLTAPVEADSVMTDLDALTTYVTRMPSSSADYPGVPELVRYARPTARGDLSLCVVWGIVLNGAKRRHLRFGSYYFVAVLEDELGDCLTRVFQIERVLTI